MKTIQRESYILYAHMKDGSPTFGTMQTSTRNPAEAIERIGKGVIYFNFFDLLRKTAEGGTKIETANLSGNYIPGNLITSDQLSQGQIGDAAVFPGFLRKTDQFVMTLTEPKMLFPFFNGDTVMAPLMRQHD